MHSSLLVFNPWHSCLTVANLCRNLSILENELSHFIVNGSDMDGGRHLLRAVQGLESLWSQSVSFGVWTGSNICVSLEHDDTLQMLTLKVAKRYVKRNLRSWKHPSTQLLLVRDSTFIAVCSRKAETFSMRIKVTKSYSSEWHRLRWLLSIASEDPHQLVQSTLIFSSTETMVK